MEGAFMLHRLPAFFFNARKRIIKAPKVYLRDTGVMHRLVKISTYEELRSHPTAGASWEAYIVEQIYQLKSREIDMFYYRTQDGAEADVVLTKAGKPVSCIEIKLSNAPSISKGFYQSIADLKTEKNFVVIPEGEAYPGGKGLTVCGIREFLGKHLVKIK
jgi:predicted AAA+ superfamily ATPase